jgi:cystathionine gamma-synthase
MPQESLRQHPLWRAEDLGKPIPPTKHAISMCLPRWQDVIGYEEKDPATLEQLQLGYPRFFHHPLVEEAFAHFRHETDGQVQIYTTRAAAERCESYLKRNHPDAAVALRPLENSPATLISFPEASAGDAKEYWQHAGEGISSRCAEVLLGQACAPDGTAAEALIRRRVAEYSGTAPGNVYLFPSGMAAINAALLMLQDISDDRPTVQFAFPYGDTLKLQEKTGSREAWFFPRGDAADLRALEARLETCPTAGLFCEFPTNPLLTSVDLPRLRKLADTHRFPIIIDETLGACINQDTLPVSDASVISLTKYFSGTSDVMGGALILNPESGYAERFAGQLETLHEPEAFHPADLVQLAIDSEDCTARVRQSNRTALRVCEFLQCHPAVEQVFHPSITDRAMYDRFRNKDGGYGGLFSFVLMDAAKHTEAFYDALEISKGPNLGTSFSLCCPFILLAHYDELEWAEAAGASRYLIRISAGLESPEELIARIRRAFDACGIEPPEGQDQ